MRRTVTTALLSAGLVAAVAGPSFAGKPAPPPQPVDYAVTVNVTVDVSGQCGVDAWAAFVQVPEILPTEWRTGDSTRAPVKRFSKSPIDTIDDAGSSGIVSLRLSAGQTAYFAFAPVYDSGLGATVTGSYTCVI